MNQALLNRILKMLAIFIFFTDILLAQSSFYLPNTEIISLKSRTNNINYRLYVSLPKDYTSSHKKYPVVYLLDADYSFALAHNITEHLSDRNDLEKLILVGIAYDLSSEYKLNRTRDYTPTFTATGGYSDELQKHSGGGPKFRDFISSELIPYIDKNFKSNGERTLVGHSFGGLFGSWIILTQNHLFNNYILVSPSLWYDQYYLNSLKATQSLTGRKIYFSIGSLENRGNYKMVDDLKKFYRYISKRNRNTRIQVFSGENHNSVFPSALSKGLLYIYGR